jgi:hypothetical protein
MKLKLILFFLILITLSKTKFDEIAALINIESKCEGASFVIFTVTSFNSLAVEVDYVSGESFVGKILLLPGKSYEVYVFIGSVVNFSYNGNVFRTMESPQCF